MRDGDTSRSAGSSTRRRRRGTSGSPATRPSPDLAHLVERHWIVEWDLRRAVHAGASSPTRASTSSSSRTRRSIHGVVTGRFRRQLDRLAATWSATKFRPGGFHPFHPGARAHADRRARSRMTFGEPGADGADRGRPTARRSRSWRRSCARDGPERRPARRRDRRAARADPRRRRHSRASSSSSRARGYSTRTLQRLFREYVGVTPKWVLQRVRLHEAAERMADGERGLAARSRSTSATSTRRTSSRPSRPSSAARPADYAAHVLGSRAGRLKSSGWLTDCPAHGAR